MARKELIITGPRFFSRGDEKAFFDWLQCISCVERVEGDLRHLRVTLKKKPSNPELREMIALLYRYRINMRPLAALKNDHNAAWFDADSSNFWHVRVFGKPSRDHREQSPHLLPNHDRQGGDR
jgi:hypothetical protein